MNKFPYFLLILSYLISAHLNAQTVSYKTHYLGISCQVYPAGIIASMHTEFFRNMHSSIYLRLGGNFANRKAWSNYNETEKGNGFGVSGAYRRHIFLKKGNIFLGINCDLWNMWIHWKNDIGKSTLSWGTTYTLVVQPWLELGYFVPIKKSKFQIGLTTGFGREINTITIGKHVGQGWMNSLLCYFQFKI